MPAGPAFEPARSPPGQFHIRPGLRKIPVRSDDSYRVGLGKAHLRRPGNDATIIANGIMVHAAAEAADILSQEGIDCRLLNMATLRPMDDEAIVAAARETGCIVTAEEHQIGTGMSAMVSQVVGAVAPVPLGAVGVADCYAESGTWTEVMEKYGLTADAIVREVKAVIERKGG